MKNFLIQNGTLVRSQEERQVDILIKEGMITSITSELSTFNSQLSTTEAIDATGLLIMPGLIDCHVHFREPGLEHKATMKTEAMSALAGGVTTVCEMPNTNPPTVTITALADKVRRADEIKDCDIRFFFGVIKAVHLVALRELWTGDSAELQRLKKQCCGVKLYLDHSTGDQKIDGEILDEAFKVCAELGVTVVCHCEDASMNKVESEKWKVESDVSAHSKMRPPESEEKSITDAIALARIHGTHLHVAHLSTKQGIDLVRNAKKEGLSVTCEVAPHHLFLTVDDYKTLGTLGKMNPPLRTKEHQDALWEGVSDGTVDCISTDHAPHTFEEKKAKNPLEAPNGVPGVETMLPLLLTKLKPTDILRLCFQNPNRIFSLRKNDVAEGSLCDFILVDPNVSWTIRGKDLHSKCGWTPYEGWEVKGKVVRTVKG
jgi:dihydroorotase